LLSSDVLRGRRAAFLLVLALAAPAAAQPAASPPPVAPGAGTGGSFLPRAGFTFGWAGLGTADQRFDWQAQLRFDLDVYAHRSGRIGFRGEYEAILGRERRPYDLNQGSYRFEVSASFLTRPAEIVLLSQHVSRHVVDREHEPSISWNTFGVRLKSRWTPETGVTALGARVPGAMSTEVNGEIEIARAMQQAYVDYAWTSRARLALGRRLTPRVAMVAAATGEVLGVKRGLVRNERVCGGRIEGGFRVRGGAAALEVFVGYERRIDAFPTDRFRVRWITAGFRIVSSPGG
jgi:hypothetical protein